MWKFIFGKAIVFLGTCRVAQISPRPEKNNSESLYGCSLSWFFCFKISKVLSLHGKHKLCCKTILDWINIPGLRIFTHFHINQIVLYFHLITPQSCYEDHSSMWLLLMLIFARNRLTPTNAPFITVSLTYNLNCSFMLFFMKLLKTNTTGIRLCSFIEHK